MDTSQKTCPLRALGPRAPRAALIAIVGLVLVVAGIVMLSAASVGATPFG